MSTGRRGRFCQPDGPPRQPPKDQCEHRIRQKMLSPSNALQGHPEQHLKADRHDHRPAALPDTNELTIDRWSAHRQAIRCGMADAAVPNSLTHAMRTRPNGLSAQGSPAPPPRHPETVAGPDRPAQHRPHSDQHQKDRQAPLPAPDPFGYHSDQTRDQRRIGMMSKCISLLTKAVWRPFHEKMVHFYASNPQRRDR